MNSPSCLPLNEKFMDWNLNDDFYEPEGFFVNTDTKSDFGSKFDLNLNKVLESSSLTASDSLIKMSFLDVLTDNLKSASETWKNTVSFSTSIFFVHQKTNLPGNNMDGLIRVFNAKAYEIETLNQLFFDSFEKYSLLNNIDISLFKDHFTETLAINFELTTWNLKNFLKDKFGFSDVSEKNKLIDFLYIKIDSMTDASLRFWGEIKKELVKQEKINKPHFNLP